MMSLKMVLGLFLFFIIQAELHQNQNQNQNPNGSLLIVPTTEATTDTQQVHVRSRMEEFSGMAKRVHVLMAAIIVGAKTVPSLEPMRLVLQILARFPGY